MIEGKTMAAPPRIWIVRDTTATPYRHAVLGVFAKSQDAREFAAGFAAPGLRVEEHQVTSENALADKPDSETPRYTANEFMAHIEKQLGPADVAGAS